MLIAPFGRSNFRGAENIVCDQLAYFAASGRKASDHVLIDS